MSGSLGKLGTHQGPGRGLERKKVITVWMSFPICLVAELVYSFVIRVTTSQYLNFTFVFCRDQVLLSTTSLYSAFAYAEIFHPLVWLDTLA